jgi:acyl-CoA synthetase (AMP-forming)/AMP-acid ligase II
VKSFDFPKVPWHELLRASGQRLPEKPAVIFRDQPITFGRLLEDGYRVARGLRRFGVRQGDRVLLSMHNRPEYLQSLFATSLLGAIAVPMNPSYKHEEVRHHLADSGSAVAIIEAPTWMRASGIRTKLAELKHVIVLDDEAPGTIPWEQLSGQSPEPIEPASIAPEEDLCVILYSSGTTGRPKGVMLTHQNLVASHFQYLAAGKVTERDVSLIFVPGAHVYGLNLMGGALAIGATQVLLERYARALALALTERYGVTLFYATTSVLIELMHAPDVTQFNLASVRYFNAGGAPLPAEVASRVEKRFGIKVANGFGLTEAPISGSRVPGEERKIVDLETGVELPPYEQGEILIRGFQVMKGYWSDPTATAEVLKNGWLHTGDIGYLDDRGWLTVVSRKKEMIKYKGFAVSPVELEGVLLDHPAIVDAAVVGRPHAECGEIPKAYVVLEPGAQVTAEELMAYVGNRIAEFKRIREFEFVPEIPRNSPGKILKRLLFEQP